MMVNGKAVSKHRSSALTKGNTIEGLGSAQDEAW